MSYDEFERFHHPNEISIVDYLNEFKRLYNKIKKGYEMELPTGILA